MTTYYSSDHQWIDDQDSESCTVGITLHAQEALGDVVFVELPAVGSVFDAGAVAGAVESVKAAADVCTPVGGEIVAVNEALRDDPSLVNTDPMGEGWFFKLRVTDRAGFGQLLDRTAYQTLINAG